MSGFVALFQRDGSPVDRALLGGLTSFLSFRGPDARASWGGLAHFSEDISGVFTCGVQDGVNNGPCTEDDGSFAFDVGGGVDVHFTHSIAVRLAEFDFDQTRMFGGSANGNSNQNNWKVKAGIIFHFGGE